MRNPVSAYSIAVRHNIKDLEETKKVLDSHSQIKNPRGNKTLFTAKSLRLYSDSDV